MARLAPSLSRPVNWSAWLAAGTLVDPQASRGTGSIVPCIPMNRPWWARLLRWFQ